MHKKRIVVVGGGTGTHTVLSGLRKYSETIDIRAIVSMADSGGSTGRLRDEFGHLPSGDVRNALTALAGEGDGEDTLLRQLFMYRFDRGTGLAGHNFGNLFLTALTDILGSEVKAILAASRLLAVSGCVIPVTTENVHLIASYADGTQIQGEHEIELYKGASTITNLTLTKDATLFKDARAALKEADLIVLGPGDLYTSVIANCIVRGFKEALQASNARIVYVCNLMSRPGQTDGFGTRDYSREITRYTGIVPDYLLVNNATLPKGLLKRYAKVATYPVLNTGADSSETKVLALNLLASEAVKTSKGDVLTRSLIRHDPHILATILLDVL